ncbi:odorant receptor 2a-like [Agrilus planipennis]|uniref:Odorant receptor 2a-like n=1 Tax=Agrilus planipennis TaxID=224129 RepID=A0A1W4WH69_AGRPL|nr:odorant receptor 2a-like [Agrilus planipennis]
MALYSVAHLKILMEAIRTIRERSYKQLNIDYIPECPDWNPRIQKVMDEEMNLCILHLQAICRMCNRIEEIYQIIMLVQAMNALALFCTSLFLLSSVPLLSSSFLVELIYWCGLIWQFLQYCWYGDRLTTTSLQVSDAFYEADWLHASKSFKHKMLFSMCRLRRPIILTAGKFMYLKLSTFVAILKASYSFYALLKNSSGGPTRLM